jgi:hypothetical protein
MVEPRRSVTRFTEAVVRAELSHGGDVDDSGIAQRITMRLHKELGKLLGPAGIDVLLARSVVLARRTHPVLARIAAGSGGTITGLDDAALEGADLHEGAMAIVSHFIELLASLIGEDLAMDLVRGIWPAAAEEEDR